MFPRFTLRLLLLAVAVLCAWLAWERSVVAKRRDFWATTKRDCDGSPFVLMEAWVLPNSTQAYAPRAWGLRRWLGDKPAALIVYYGDDHNHPEIRRVARLFPEAYVVSWPKINNRADYQPPISPGP